MILTCPECATSYFVDDSKIPRDGRIVKCANCGARWTATLEAPLDLESSEEEGALARERAADPEDEPRAVSDLTGEDLPKVFRAKADTERKVRAAATTGIIIAAVVAVFAVIVALLVVFRVNVVRAWPQSAGAYALVGLPVNSLGLVIEGVKAEPSLQDGHAALSVSGMIRNIEDVAVVAPPLRITLISKAGKTLSTKIARPADARVPPGQTRHFALAILDPPSTAHDLEVAFAPEAAKAPPAKAAAAAHGGAVSQQVSLRPAPPPPAPPLPAPVDAKPLPADSPYALEPQPHG
jgi:predicted Zn finger-like uncharacterized protein